MSLDKKSFVSSVAGASIILASISVFSKGVGFFREILYANTFGLNKEFDLYLVSAAIPITINTAVIYIGQHFFVPTYHQLKKESDLKAVNFFNSAFYFFILGGILLSLLLGLFSHQIINLFISQQSSVTKNLTTNLFLLFLITIPLNAGVSILTSYMQSEYKFTLPALAQLLINLTIILMVLFLSGAINIYVLPVAFIIGNLIALIILIISSRKNFRAIDFEKFNYLKIEKSNLLLILTFIEFISLSYPIIDRYFYARIPEGGIAALNYALTVYSMPVSIFTLALITAIFPKFSQQANESHVDLVIALKKGININIFLIVPISAILIFNGYDLIKLFYERGEFVAADTKMTELVLIYYSISLIFYSTYLLAIKLLYSLSLHIWILIISVAGFIIKIVLNFLLVDSLYQNGLALSTSIVFILLFLSGFFIAGKNLRQRLNSYCFKKIIYSVTNVIFSYLSVYIVSELLRLDKLNLFTFKVITFLTIYILNSIVIKGEDFEMASGFIKQYLPGILKSYSE